MSKVMNPIKKISQHVVEIYGKEFEKRKYRPLTIKIIEKLANQPVLILQPDDSLTWSNTIEDLEFINGESGIEVHIINDYYIVVLNTHHPSIRDVICFNY